MGKPAFVMHGLDAIGRLLMELPGAVSGKVLEDAAMAGGQPILDDARANVSVDEGTLKDALDMKVVSYPKSMTSAAIVGPRSREAGHAHLVEFGTNGPRETKDGKSTGTMPPKPFMRPAVDKNRSGSIDAMGRVLGAGIEREAKRLAKGAK